MLHKKRHKKKKMLIDLHAGKHPHREIATPPTPDEDYPVEDGGAPLRHAARHDDGCGGMDDGTDDFSVTGQRF